MLARRHCLRGTSVRTWFAAEPAFIAGEAALAVETESRMLARNTLVQGRYQIVRLLKKGGMGAVYEAIDLRLKTPVALKQMIPSNEPHLAPSLPLIKKAFEREAQILAGLDHPALPKVSDYFTDGGAHFLVMQFIPGLDLAEQLQQRSQPFPVNDVLDWADTLLDALEYLHTRQPPIIHRDIKPGNLKLSPRGRIILLDFGLAKGAPAIQSQFTAGSSILHGHTPYYAPPEQIHGRRTDHRSDLYALGATLYDLLTNRRPVNADVRVDAVEDGGLDPLRPIHERNPKVPPAISAAVHHALVLRPDDRPQSATEMRAEFQAASQLASEEDRGAYTIRAAPTLRPLAAPPKTVKRVPPALPPSSSGVGLLLQRPIGLVLMLLSILTIVIIVLIVVLRLANGNGADVTSSQTTGLTSQIALVPPVTSPPTSQPTRASYTPETLTPTYTTIPPSPTYTTIPPTNTPVRPTDTQTSPTSTPATPTSTETTPTIAPQGTNIEIPEVFIHRYFDLINSRKYNEAWALLSDIYKCYQEGGYDEFQRFWNTIRHVEVDAVRTLDYRSDNALIDLTVTFTNEADGSTSKEYPGYQLILNNNHDGWLINRGKSGLSSNEPTSPSASTFTVGQKAAARPPNARDLWNMGGGRVHERPKLYGGAVVTILAIEEGAVCVRTEEGVEGWIREQTADALTHDLTVQGEQNRFSNGTCVQISLIEARPDDGIPLHTEPRSTADTVLPNDLAFREQAIVQEVRGDWLRITLDNGTVGWARWYYDGDYYIDPC